ncbi:hypothetical protein [Crocinitomix catalasitica]|uniref:hypothetical protein n=1 Tax=Crocinitomix catalasitica TaxID=184607 RepID=UPI0012FC610C|nr:hypothetical protein [Crocinitomix catalasitica]
MKEQLENLIERIEEIERINSQSTPEMEDLEFSIYESEPITSGPTTISSKGNHRKWKETRDLRGAKKYSNFSVVIKILDKNSKPVVCDWIKLSDCNYSIKQNRTVVESSSISFTTHTKTGWPDITFKVQIKYQGSIYKEVSVRLG